MDADFFKPFVDGTLETLKIQCGTEAVPRKPFMQAAAQPSETAIAAVIGVTGDCFRATVTLCFPEKTFLKIMSNMLGETCTAITPELEDGVAELLNIIFGAAKRTINQKHGSGIQMAIPTILRGTGLQARALTNGRVVVLPFVTPEGDGFNIQISTDSGVQTKGGVA